MLSVSTRVKCPGKVSSCENTAGECLESSQRASRCVDDVSNTSVAKLEEYNFLCVKRGAIKPYPKEDEKDVNLERQQDSRAFGDKNKQKHMVSMAEATCPVLSPANSHMKLPERFL